MKIKHYGIKSYRIKLYMALLTRFILGEVNSFQEYWPINSLGIHWSVIFRKSVG